MQKVLIVGPAWVGDMVMAQSLFILLQRNCPGVEIDVIAPAWSVPILKRMPEVRRPVEIPVGHGELGLAARYLLGRQLRGEGYDQAIVLPRSFKSAITPFFAGIPRRTGYRGEMRFGLINDMRPLDKARLPGMVQRYVALGLERDAELPPAEIPQPRLEVDTQNQQRLLKGLGLSHDTPVVAFMPAAEYGPAKRWPPEYFAELAQRLVSDGRQVWLFGSAKDTPLCREVQAVAGEGVVDLSGKTRLEDAVDLLAMVERTVTNDSGLMHVAAAVGAKVVAVYGSSSPEYTPPLSDRAEVVYLGLECSPCFERECPLGHYRCLRDISPEEVFRLCQQ